MYKFRTDLGAKILKHKILKETNKQITYENVFFSKITHEDKIRIDIENKISSWYSWHNTLEEAKTFLIEKHNQKIQKLNNQIEYVKKQIESVISLNID